MTFVFDTEPLIAYLLDEPGADVVEEIVQEVAENPARSCYVSPVTKMEVTYIAQHAGVNHTDVGEFLETLAENGVETFDAERCWKTAAAYKYDHNVALGDAFSLATADVNDATLVVGADDDFDGIEGGDSVAIVRIREEAA